MDEAWLVDIPQGSELENELLTSTFTKQEVRNAIFQMETNKAPCPGGFPLEFYQGFWSIIKEYLMPLF